MLTQILGNPVSPFVRKVLAVLEYKEIKWEVDPFVPFFGDDRFTRLSPARRVPVLIDDLLTVPDSSVICQYLEERYPRPHVYPEDIALRARARWLEEFADTRIAEVLIWKLFNQKIIAPNVWGTEPDPAIIDQALHQDIPHLMSVLDDLAPEEGFFCGPELSIADIAVAAPFRNARFAGYEVDVETYPRAGSLIVRTLAQPCFQALRPWESTCIRTPLKEHRQALIDAGCNVTAETYGTDVARRS